MNGQNQNACSNVLFKKHRAEVKQCGFTHLPGNILCEEVPHLEMYNVEVGSELGRSIGGSLGTVLETFSRLKVVPRHSNGNM